MTTIKMPEAALIMNELKSATGKEIEILDFYGNSVCSTNERIHDCILPLQSKPLEIEHKRVYKSENGLYFAVLKIEDREGGYFFVAVLGESEEELNCISRITGYLANSIYEKSSSREQKKSASLDREDYFRELLFSSLSSDEAMVRAMENGINPRQKCCLAVTRLGHSQMDSLDYDAYNDAQEMIARLMQSYCMDGVNVSLKANDRYIMISSSLSVIIDCTNTLHSKIAERWAGKLKPYTAISEYAEPDLTLSQRYKDALLICDTLTSDERQIVYQKDCSLELLVEKLPDDAKKAFVEQVFKDCPDEDIYEWDRIVKLLDENDGSIKSTADEMFVHKNTLQYRLNRIKERINLDARSSEDAVILRVAFLVWNSLKRGKLPQKYK